MIFDLDPECLAKVTDLIEAPPAAGKFQALKDEKKLQELLNNLGLGHQRPSQLTRIATEDHLEVFGSVPEVALVTSIIRRRSKKLKRVGDQRPLTVGPGGR